MDKIPKILHFIWFGYMPNYVNFCIENYKNINPDFKINFVHRTPK
jgi:mannosyltransferase OCH1-like enzyme